MRTKLLFSAAAVLAASSLFASAQIYSANVVGYVQRAVPLNNGANPTYACVANPLDTGTNTLINLVQGLPIGSKVLKWNPTLANFSTFTRSTLPGGWSPLNSGSNTLNPGESAFISLATTNTSPYTNVFLGTVVQGSSYPNQSVIMLPGFTALSFPPAISGAVTNANINLNAYLPNTPSGSQFITWNEVSQAGYTIATRNALPSGWSAVPSITPGVGFFINNAASSNRVWTINFTVQ